MGNNILQQGKFYLSTLDGETIYLGDGSATIEQEETVVAEIPYTICASSYNPFTLTVHVNFERERILRKLLGTTEYQWRKANMSKKEFKYWKKCQNRKRIK